MSLAKPIRQLNTGYSTKSNTAAISPELGKMLRIYSVRLVNESGSTIACALLQKKADGSRTVFTFNGTVYTDVTATLNTPSDINIFVGNGTGFSVQSPEAFQALLLTVSGAGSTGGTRTVSYWNGTTFTAVLQVIDGPTNFATGAQVIYFSPGPDWVPGGPVGFDQNQYSIRVTSTAPSATTTSNQLNPAKAIQYSPAVPTASAFESAFDINYPLQFEGGDVLVPYFGTASANNKVISFYSQEN